MWLTGLVQIGSGYLNNWDFSGKESSMPPGGNKDKDSVFVNEAPGN